LNAGSLGWGFSRRKKGKNPVDVGLPLVYAAFVYTAEKAGWGEEEEGHDPVKIKKKK